jgi:hypothetical protein
MARRSDDAVTDKPKRSRIRQVRQTYAMARRVDRRIGWWTFGTALLVVAVTVALGLLVGPLWMWLVLGLPIAFLAAVIVFGRRAERAAYRQIEGQPGAAMSALSTLRRGWVATPAVVVNRQQDVIHRVTGRAGIVLVGEGNPQRLGAMLGQERRRCARIAADTPVHEIVVGNDEGQVPLRKLGSTVTKLPKALSGSQVAELNRRLRAMPASPVPMPKGPLPRNVKLPKGSMPPRSQSR